MNHERLWTLKNNLRVLKGRGGGWEIGGARWWVLWRAHIAWSTGCGAKNNEFCYEEKKLKKESVMQCPSVSLTTVFSLKSNLSDMRIAALAFF